MLYMMKMGIGNSLVQNKMLLKKMLPWLVYIHYSDWIVHSKMFWICQEVVEQRDWLLEENGLNKENDTSYLQYNTYGWNY